MGACLIDGKSTMARDRRLAAVPQAFVGNVANVVRIEALGSTPVIADVASRPKPGTAGPAWLLSSAVDRLAQRSKDDSARRALR
jgi:hypothetical protein